MSGLSSFLFPEATCQATIDKRRLPSAGREVQRTKAVCSLQRGLNNVTRGEARDYIRVDM